MAASAFPRSRVEIRERQAFGRDGSESLDPHHAGTNAEMPHGREDGTGTVDGDREDGAPGPDGDLEGTRLERQAGAEWREFRPRGR